MKIAALLLALLLLPPAFSAGTQKAGKAEPPAYTGKHLSLDVRDAPVVDLIRLFSDISGQTFVVDPAMGLRTITVDVGDVPWDQILAMLLESTGLAQKREGDTIRVFVPAGLGSGGAEPQRAFTGTLRLYRGTRKEESGVRSEGLDVGLRDRIAVIDSDWAEGVASQERELQETFGLQDVELVIEREFASYPTGSIVYSRGDNEDRSTVVLQVRPGPPRTGKLLARIVLQAGKSKSPYDTEVVLSERKPLTVGTRDEAGEYHFLSLTVDSAAVDEKPAAAAAATAGANLAPPRLVESTEPAYPEELKKQGIEGEVVLRAKIAATGAVEEVSALRSSDERFVQAALDAVKKWKYEPLQWEGKPTNSEIVIRVQFRLEK